MSKVKVGSTEKLQTVHLILDGRETQSQEVRSSFRFSVRHKGIKKLLTSNNIRVIIKAAPHNGCAVLP